ERLTRDDALALFRSPDLLTIGRLADLANRRRNGDRVFFAANQHINPTNVCVLRNTCVFCSFARMPQEHGAYTRSLDEVFAEAEAARGNATREFHIVGGLHPKLRLDYYLEMFRGLRERHPGVQIKALTAVEVAHLARIEGMTVPEVLAAMKDAGVTSLPGGGAEVFSPAARRTIADRKLSGEEWLAVHREAHRLGIPSNCTMLYGHIETAEDRVDHLLALRALQDETGGFLCYIPLAYHPDHNELGEALGRTGTATTGFDDLKNLAVGRLVLDNIPHVKTHWPMVTPLVSQVALDFGCDDLEGTVVFERVYHEAGAETPMWLSYDQIVGLIRGAGKTPVERDSLYQPVRTFESWTAGAPLPAVARAEGPEGPTFHIEHRRTPATRRRTLPIVSGEQVGASAGASPSPPARRPGRPRVGRIGYINCYPVYAAIDRGIVPVPGELVTGTPAELNDLLAAGELDVSVISAVEYARHARDLVLLPDIAISSDGPVRSVILYSRRPIAELAGRTVLVSASSRTSVALLELLCRHVWKIGPRLAQARAEAADLHAVQNLPHDGLLVIGDPALLLGARRAYPYAYDLGEEWKRWTGLPFVFAVWAARRSADPAAVRPVYQAILASRAWGLAHVDELAQRAAATSGVPLEICRAYFAGLDYGFGYKHLAGLADFFRRLAHDGRVPDGSLQFLEVA
ncbi:MAG TPA: aminofutalosine synthase MqnE, partial [Gemmatimonadales bacterium]|nr:aminofutalosine synthase MqnE [Gemmatimonadales bacterium]